VQNKLILLVALAADNMAANPGFLKEFEIEFGALLGSLDMTAKGQFSPDIHEHKS
jgi:hypothetical protein